jgi:hypothetical protein
VNDQEIDKLDVGLERDSFMRDMLRHLTGTLEDIVGLDEASGFISVVGQRMGDDICKKYLTALNVDRLDRSQVARVLVDLKQRIRGNFSIASEDSEKIVLRTTSCPFGNKVIGRPSLCMMTSTVFGTIAADNLGYAKVSLDETIAGGAPGCLITIYLKESDESEGSDGKEYYRV